MSEKQAADPTALNLYQKLAAIMGEIGTVAKDGKNSEQKYAFIEYAAVAGKLRTLFAKYEVLIIPRMQEASKQKREPITSKYGSAGEHVLIDFYFQVLNATTPSETFTVRWTGEAADFGDKASNKAATGALKYYLMRQFNISEKGEDPDAESPDVAPKPTPGAAASAKPAPSGPAMISEPQLRKMQALFGELGVLETEERLKYVQQSIGHPVERASQITATEASRVIDRVEQDLFELSGRAA